MEEEQKEKERGKQCGVQRGGYKKPVTTAGKEKKPKDILD